MNGINFSADLIGNPVPALQAVLDQCQNLNCPFDLAASLKSSSFIKYTLRHSFYVPIDIFYYKLILCKKQ